MPMKVRDVIRKLEEDGWVLDRQGGTSHRQFKKDNNPNTITVAGQPGKDITPGQLSDIRRKSGLPLR